MVALLFLILGVLLITCGWLLLQIHRAQQAGIASFMYSLTHHSLSNPIQSAQAATDNIERELRQTQRPENKRCVEAVNDLNQSLSRLSSTAHNLRHLALLEVDSSAVLNERINIVKIAQELILELGPEAEKSGVRLLYEGKSKAITVLQQPEFVRNILENVLRNALKYTIGQKEACVVLSLVHQSEKAIVVISDNGTGINREQLNSLTRQPQRPMASTISKAGTGLGLYLVRRLLAQCGGKIDISSEINRGTVVTIQLPAMAAVEQ